MHIVVENKAFLGRARTSEHRIPARNALQSEKCADLFRGSVPWVPPGAAAGSACHSCCEAAAGSITPGVAAYERTGHRRPPGPHRDPASAARKPPEYSPNTSRRPPAGHHPNTSRILPDGRPKTHANTSRIPREYFPGTFRVTSGLYAIPLVANYSRSIRAVFGRLFAQVFAWVFGCVFGRSSGGIREVFGGARAVFGKGSVGIRAAFLPRMRGLGGGQAGGHSLPVPAKALFDHSAACATPWRDARGQRWDFGTAAPQQIFATYALQAFPTLEYWPKSRSVF